jgi:hypothetical protein
VNFSLTNQNATGKVLPVSSATSSKEKRKDIYSYGGANRVSDKEKQLSF